MKLIIVRHGETTENAKTQDIGHDNEALLTQEGILQAKKLGEYLRHEKISHAYTSPQKRAVHTAREILAHHPDAKVEHVDDLREQNLGVAETLPKHVWKEIKKNTKEPFHLFKAEGGESYMELQARAKKFLHNLVKKHLHPEPGRRTDDTVLVVSHGGTLGVLLLHILEKELTEENYKAHQPKNTEFSVIEIVDDGTKKVHVINSREHLN